MRLHAAYRNLLRPSSVLEPSHPLRGLVHTYKFLNHRSYAESYEFQMSFYIQNPLPLVGLTIAQYC